MRNKIKIWRSCIWMLFIFLFSNSGYATIQPDTSRAISVDRRFSNNGLEAYRSLPQYNYTQDPEYISNPLARLRAFLYQKLAEFFGSAAAGKVFKIIYGLIILLAFTGILYHLLRAQGGDFFQKDTKVINPEIRLMDMNAPADWMLQSIAAAEKEGRYREAIRLMFLLVIRYLDEQKIVEWHPEMTNSALLGALPAGKRDKMRHLVRIYEYIWYGEHEVSDPRMFQNYKGLFQQFMNQEIREQ